MGTVPADEAAARAEDEPNAERMETYTRDFIIETLLKELEGFKFESFVAHLLEAMGYRIQVTQAVGDGGFDIIAHRDPLGLEPPIIKVQCKRTLGSIGAPDVQKLTDTLAPGGSELGLFVTLGSYSKDAQHLGRTRQDLRLVNGNELVALVFAHYESFGPEWKRLLPPRPRVRRGPRAQGELTRSETARVTRQTPFGSATRPPTPSRSVWKSWSRWRGHFRRRAGNVGSSVTAAFRLPPPDGLSHRADSDERFAPLQPC